MTSVTGFPDKPTRTGVSIADFSSGFFTALSIVSALFYKFRTGEGQVIDMSMQDCIWQLASIEYAPYVFLNNQNPPRLGNGHSAMIPCNLYPTKDGHIIISAGVLVKSTDYIRLSVEKTLSIHLWVPIRNSAINIEMKSMRL
jgi:crotonobetainyl-CoA:carnitine CoA-transferase CaiB-like acyl-CoA transferase